jgi:hypothetical protein
VDSIWQIPVIDSVGRPRSVRVEVRRSGVAVLPPPGGGFTVEADRVEELRSALAAARAEALKDERW